MCLGFLNFLIEKILYLMNLWAYMLRIFLRLKTFLTSCMYVQILCFILNYILCKWNYCINCVQRVSASSPKDTVVHHPVRTNYHHNSRYIKQVFWSFFYEDPAGYIPARISSCVDGWCYRNNLDIYRSTKMRGFLPPKSDVFAKMSANGYLVHFG